MRRFGRRAHKDIDSGLAIDVSEKDGIRSLHLGSGAIQSSMRIKDPYELVLGYNRSLFGFLLFREPPRDFLMIGLGGGSIPKFVHKHMPDTRTVVVELLPQIIGVARSMFHLPPDDERLQVIQGDGAEYVANMTAPVDGILLDAYGSTGIVEPLATEAFFAQCRDKLTGDGVLLVNLWQSDPRFNVYVDRLSRAFDNHILCLPVRQRGNVATLCFNRSQHNPTWASLKERASALELRYPLEFREFASDLAHMNEHNDRRLLI